VLCFGKVGIFISSVGIDKKYFENIYRKYIPGNPDFKNDWIQFVISHEVMVYIKKFITEYQERIIGYKDILEALSEIICHSLIRGIVGVKTEKNLISDNFEIENIIEYMHQHFGQKITVEELAKKTNMSKSHFIRVFKKSQDCLPWTILSIYELKKQRNFLAQELKTFRNIVFMRV